MLLPVEPALLAYWKTAHGKGVGDQYWTASLRDADSHHKPKEVGFSCICKLQGASIFAWRMCFGFN